MRRRAESRRGWRAARHLRCVLLAAAIKVLLAPALASPHVPVRVDHHVHVHAPEIRAFLPGYCASPGRGVPCDPDFLDPPPLEALLAAMDGAGVQRAALMSTGYLAESPMMVPAHADAAGLLRAGNDFTVALARAHPSRFLAFIGLNPLTPTALSEIARWRDDPAVSGIKLHLTNSGVDLRAAEHVAALAAVFREASAAGLAIAIHMRTRDPDYGAQDVRIFIEQVLPQARGVPVQIAHAAGWGRTDANTFSALEAFADALAEAPSWHDQVYFDLAAVHGDESSDGDLFRLAALVRRIGPGRFVAASDWPFALDLADYYQRRYPLLPLSAQEWATIRRNTSLAERAAAP